MTARRPSGALRVRASCQRLPARVLARYLAEGGAARTKIWRAGMLTVFDDRLLPIDLAVGDWARWDETVAERLRRVDDKRLA